MSNLPSKVQVPNADTVQANIDNNQVVTAAGTVQRQVISIGDPTTGSQYATVDAGGRLAVIAGVNVTTDGSVALTTGGSAQNIFSGATPTNGFSIANPDLNNDLWISDSATALANGLGSIRVSANGGYYCTEPGQKPLGPISVVGVIDGQFVTARQW